MDRDKTVEAPADVTGKIPILVGIAGKRALDGHEDLICARLNDRLESWC